MGDTRDPAGKADPTPATRDRPHLRDTGAHGVAGRVADPPVYPEGTSVQSPSGASVSAAPSGAAGGSLPAGQRGDGLDVAGAAKEGASQAAEYAKAKTHSFAEEQKTAAAGQIGGMAEALRKSARQLHEDQQTAMADYIGRAADRLDGFARSLREQDARALMAQADDLARRQPGLFMGGAMLGGFLLARFLKSSGARSAAAGYDARDRYTTAGVGSSASQSREI